MTNIWLKMLELYIQQYLKCFQRNKNNELHV